MKSFPNWSHKSFPEIQGQALLLSHHPLLPCRLHCDCTGRSTPHSAPWAAGGWPAPPWAPPVMQGASALELLLPRPWCLYNYLSHFLILSQLLLCSIFPLILNILSQTYVMLLSHLASDTSLFKLAEISSSLKSSSFWTSEPPLQSSHYWNLNTFAECRLSGLKSVLWPEGLK